MSTLVDRLHVVGEPGSPLASLSAHHERLLAGLRAAGWPEDWVATVEALRAPVAFYEAEVLPLMLLIETLYGLSTDSSNRFSLQYAMRIFKSGQDLPADTIAIACDLAGNQFVLSRDVRRPGVFLWEHDRIGDPRDWKLLQNVAESFSDFVIKLDVLDSEQG